MNSTEMTNYVKIVFVFASLLVIVQCHLNEDSRDNNSNNDLPPGLGRLIFKQMRFRELPQLSKPNTDTDADQVYTPWEDRPDDQSVEVGKRDRKQKLIQDLAALLTNMREQETGSTLRMPSLRFG